MRGNTERAGIKLVCFEFYPFRKAVSLGEKRYITRGRSRKAAVYFIFIAFSLYECEQDR